MEHRQGSMHQRGLGKSRLRMIKDAKQDGSEDLWLSTQLGLPKRTVERLRTSLQSESGRSNRKMKQPRQYNDVCQLEFIQYQNPAGQGR